MENFCFFMAAWAKGNTILLDITTIWHECAISNVMCVHFFLSLIFGRLHAAHSTTKSISFENCITKMFSNCFLLCTHDSTYINRQLHQKLWQLACEPIVMTSRHGHQLIVRPLHRLRLYQYLEEPSQA